MVDDALAQLRALPIMQAMQIDVRIAAPEPVVAVDPQLFGEVMVNLLRNAAEACDGKGCIEITAAVDGGRLRLDVADDGPGVPAELGDEIFKPFCSSKEGGTGIGLAVCRKVVESHGGSLDLAARTGRGACFRIQLDSSANQTTEEPRP